MHFYITIGLAVWMIAFFIAIYSEHQPTIDVLAISGFIFGMILIIQSVIPTIIKYTNM